MTTIIEDGKQYVIEDGHVVSASLEQPAPDTERTKTFSVNDRVLANGKVGRVVGISPSVYGVSAAIQYDDGGFTEILEDALEEAPIDKTASLGGFEGEYEAYQNLPAITASDLAFKQNKARELNLRAKESVSTAESFADQLLYDRVITETSVDMMDLTDAFRSAESAEEKYLERQPKFTTSVASSANSYGMHKGDASWLDSAADEFVADVPVIQDSDLVEKASATVAGLSNEQLTDQDFMKKVLEYSLQTVADESKTKFAFFLKEAKNEKLSVDGANVRTASVKTELDLDGNEIDLDNVPFEAIFGA